MDETKMFVNLKAQKLISYFYLVQYLVYQMFNICFNFVYDFNVLSMKLDFNHFFGKYFG